MVVTFVLLSACGRDAQLPRQRDALKTQSQIGRENMKLSSPAFPNNARIDRQHTADGDDTSPPLSWRDVPDGARSLALICDDPDAPSPKHPAKQPWVHWVIFNIAPDISGLPAGVSRKAEPDEIRGVRQGANSWPSDNLGYRGPAPPPGSGPHRYFFKLYALDAQLDLPPGATKEQLVQAMSGHVLAEGQLIGIYER
jgi:hypothetical protein